MDAQQRQELIEFLRDNLRVEISCGHDGCGSPEVHVYLSLCGEEISSSRDWLPSPSSFECGDSWPGC